MLRKTLIVANKLGVHARPAAQLVKLSNGYKSKITIYKDELSADAGSMVELLMLGCMHGEELHIKIDGEDESDAWQGLKKLFANKFDEE